MGKTMLQETYQRHFDIKMIALQYMIMENIVLRFTIFKVLWETLE